jgi:hypothetical protein
MKLGVINLNTHFRNSTFGFAIYTGIIVIVVLSTVLIFWYMLSGYKAGLYEEDTMLGNVYLGGLKEEDVIPKMVDRTNEWIGDETIEFRVNYQGYVYEIDREVFLFDFDTSLFYLKEGQTNPLIVTFQGSTKNQLLEEIQSLPYLEDVNGLIDYDRLMTDILLDVSQMKTFSDKNLEDYLPVDQFPNDVISIEHIDLPATIDADDIVERLIEINEEASITIESKTLLDLLEVFGEYFTDRELSFIAKGMLGSSLESNFVINEVHYLPVIDTSLYTFSSFPFYGKNAYIYRFTGQTFSIFNPNETNYKYLFSAHSGNDLQVELIGLPFAYDIEITYQETVLPYSIQSTSNVGLVQSGLNGKVVEVIRTITDVYGDIIYDKEIIFEFYPPVKEVVYAP